LGLSRLKGIPGGSPGCGIGFIVIAAIDAQLALAEGGIDEMTVMGARGIRMREGHEVATGHAHALDGDRLRHL
jgi:hypothetical protein